uniref:Uncharacterized protein n=1 Tax=Rhizophora mucronata TaxID=61149 RepID=A0A2P2PZY7_RHIMU
MSTSSNYHRHLVSATENLFHHHDLPP